MTTNIYLAQLLAKEREQDFLNHAEGRRRARAARLPKVSWRDRLFRHTESEPARPVTGDTWIAA